ncbi:MAG TPA: DUF3566 domain-containing protein [Jiangellaceae bacterium]|nr:DUF3566 domain-containing protein [Jiangellaceae bacterium]
MTTNGGTGRPPSAPDVRDDDAPTVVDAPVAGPANNGSGDAPGTEAARGEPYDRFGRGSHAASSTTKASTAYEVAAALRAQASRAAQATREAAHRVQDALNTQADPGQAVANGPANRPVTPPMAAVSGAATSGSATVRPPPTGDRPAAPAGAAAAMAATAPVRPRHEVAPSSDATKAPERRPVEPPTFEPDGSSPAVPAPGHGADTVATPVAPESPPAPVVAPVVAPPVEPAAAVRTDTYATQVSVDARPEEPAYAPPSARRAPTTAGRRSGRVRKARLRLLRIDPWSVMKTAFLLSVALGITMFVAVAVLWSVLDAAGVFSAVGDLIRDLTSSETGTGFELENYTALSRVLGFTTLIAVVDVVLVTALATLGAFLYNLSASLLGGLELTLAEDD